MSNLTHTLSRSPPPTAPVPEQSKVGKKTDFFPLILPLPRPLQVSPPDLNVHVFAKFDESIPQVGFGDNRSDTVKVEKGDVWIMRYQILRPFVQDGRAHFV